MAECNIPCCFCSMTHLPCPNKGINISKNYKVKVKRICFQLLGEHFSVMLFNVCTDLETCVLQPVFARWCCWEMWGWKPWWVILPVCRQTQFRLSQVRSELSQNTCLSGAWRLWKGAQEISFMWHLWFKLKESQKSQETSCISISTSQKISYFFSLSPDFKGNQPIYRGVLNATYYNHGILAANSNSILYSWQKKLQQGPFRRTGE